MERKKIALGLMVFAAPLLFTACGSKKNVTCVSDDEGVKTTIKFTYDTKKNEFSKVAMIEEFVYADMDDDQADYVKDNIDDLCESFEDQDGVKDCKVKSDKKGGKITIDMEADELNERYEDKDFEDIIDDLEEDDDVKCKVR